MTTRVKYAAPSRNNCAALTNSPLAPPARWPGATSPGRRWIDLVRGYGVRLGDRTRDQATVALLRNLVSTQIELEECEADRAAPFYQRHHLRQELRVLLVLLGLDQLDEEPAAVKAKTKNSDVVVINKHTAINRRDPEQERFVEAYDEAIERGDADPVATAGRAVDEMRKEKGA